MVSGNKKRTQNVSEYMLVLALCLVAGCSGHSLIPVVSSRVHSHTSFPKPARSITDFIVRMLYKDMYIGLVVEQ